MVWTCAWRLMKHNGCGMGVGMKPDQPTAARFGGLGVWGRYRVGMGQAWVGMGRYGVGIGVYSIAALGRAAALGQAGMGV